MAFQIVESSTVVKPSQVSLFTIEDVLIHHVVAQAGFSPEDISGYKTYSAKPRCRYRLPRKKSNFLLSKFFKLFKRLGTITRCGSEIRPKMWVIRNIRVAYQKDSSPAPRCSEGSLDAFKNASLRPGFKSTNAQIH